MGMGGHEKNKNFLHISLFRWYPHRLTTIGIFSVFGETFYTAEDTRLILPAGVYYCYLRDGATTNRSAGLKVVYSIEEDIADRSAFQFMHVGNTHENVDGCVAGGIGFNLKVPSIVDSVKAIKKFYKLLDEKIGLNPIRLKIIEDK